MTILRETGPRACPAGLSACTPGQSIRDIGKFVEGYHRQIRKVTKTKGVFSLNPC